MKNLPTSNSAASKTARMYTAHAAMLLTTIIWGLAAVIIKITLAYIPPFTFLMIRFLTVCLVLLPFVLLELKRSPIDKRDIKNIAILGLFGQTSIALVFLGVNFSTAIDSAIMGIITPLLAIAAGHYFFKERINNFIRLGVLIATIGTLVVMVEPILTDGNPSHPVGQRLIGNMWLMIYNLAFLLYIIWSKFSLGENTNFIKKKVKFLHLKPMRKKYSSIHITTLSFYMGLITMIPLAILENIGFFGTLPTGYSLSALPLNAILGVLYMALFSSIVAYVLFEWSLKTLTMGDSAIYNYLTPLFTFPFAFVLIKELPTPITLLGCAIIFVGVVIAEHKKS